MNSSQKNARPVKWPQPARAAAYSSSTLVLGEDGLVQQISRTDLLFAGRLLKDGDDPKSHEVLDGLVVR
jgi:hypothetical protein